MGVLEVDDCQFGVVLERVQRLVAEHLLDVVHASPAPQHLGRAASPERVRRDRHAETRLLLVAMDHPPQLMVIARMA